ncbi:MAG: M28 family peptidase [Bacteroidota bacterium]
MLIEKVESENVMGFVRGKEKPDEVVIVSAHYDHLGMKDGKIYYGADDNASGTSAIIEIGEAFATAKENGDGPLRSLLFVAFSGEEEGLLGSNYYVSHPEIPLSNTVADLNIDMIGRQDLKYSEDPDYVYIIGSDRISSELDELAKSVNEDYSKIRLDYRYNDMNDPNQYYKRSDHYNFAQKNIPIIFYFNGTHGDYHQPTDTVDKINFEKVKKVTDYIFYTAWELANREERIRID